MKEKHILFSIILLLTGLSIYAQGPSLKKEKNDTTVFLWSGLKILIFNDPDSEKSKSKTDSNYKPMPKKPATATFYSGIDVGVNGLMNSIDYSTNLKGASANLDIDYSRSYNLHLNVVEKQIKIYKRQVSLVTGIGLNYNGYRFNSKTVRMVNDMKSNKIDFDTTSSREYTKNKLRVSSIEIPVLIGFATNKKDPDKGVKIATGVIGTYIYNSKYKLNFIEEKASTQQVVKDNFHLRPFTVKATVRFGYKGFMLFANYSLMSLFKDGQGPDVRPFELGISL